MTEGAAGRGHREGRIPLQVHQYIAPATVRVNLVDRLVTSFLARPDFLRPGRWEVDILVTVQARLGS